MWSTIRTVTTRGLLVGPAAEGKALAPAAGRIAGSAIAGARVHARGRVFTPVFRCVQAQQAREFAVTVVRTATAVKKTAVKKVVKKPAAKKTAAKKKPAAKKKTAAKKKPAAKKTVKAKAKKPKKKVVVKKKAKKVLTPEEKKKLLVRELKKVALLQEPGKLPETSWVLYVSENTKGVKVEMEGGRSSLTAGMAALSQGFKALSHSELQRLHDTAAKNAETNAANYKAWVESHSAVDVDAANRARAQLQRLGASKRRQIQDDRRPKRPLTSYALFTKTQWASGKYAGVPLAESGKAISAQWKALSPSEREPFETASKANLERYAEDIGAVLGRSVARKSSSPSP